MRSFVRRIQPVLLVALCACGDAPSEDASSTAGSGGSPPSGSTASAAGGGGADSSASTGAGGTSGSGGVFDCSAGFVPVRGGTPTPISSCQTINASGAYTLSSDLSVGSESCLRIENTSDVLLDCGGHVI